MPSKDLGYPLNPFLNCADLVEPILKTMIDKQLKKTRFDGKEFYRVAINALDTDHYSYGEVCDLYRKLSKDRWG